MEARLFEEGTIPEFATAAWYADRDRAPHLEQAPHQARLHTAAQYVRIAISDGAKKIIDCGAGDGGLLSLVNDIPVPRWGYDLQPTNVKAAEEERGVTVLLEDIVATGVPGGYDAVAVCTEFLEHLVNPHQFLKELDAGWVVASSPWNETYASHYGFHLWCWDADGYQALLNQAGYEVINSVQNGDGFQVMLGRRYF